MAIVYNGICRKCGKEAQLMDVDSIGIQGFQKTDYNGLCNVCVSLLKLDENDKINHMSIEERLERVEKHLKLRH